MNIASKRLSLLLLLLSVTANGQVVIDPATQTSGDTIVVSPLPATFGRRPLFTDQNESPAASFGWNPRTVFGGTSFGTDLTGPIQRPSYGYSWNFAGAEEQFDLNIIDTDPASAYTIEDIFGCEAPQQGYNLEIRDGIDFNSCFDGRNLVQPASHINHLVTDVNTCNCLKGSPVASVKEIMELSIDQNDVINVNTRVRRVYQTGMDQVINGVAFQAGVIAQNAPEEVRKAFVEDYSKSPFSFDPSNPEVLIRKGKDISLNLQPTRNLRLGRDDIPYPEIREANGRTTPVCLSMVAFHRMRQMPAPREREYIVTELSRDYDKDAWNYNELQKDYDSIMNESPAVRRSKVAEIQKLKTKLSFLNRNPLMKYFMGADKKDFDAVVKGAEMMGEGFDLKSKQSELFGLVKNALTKPECSGAGLEACGNDLRNTLRRFFGNRDHSGIIGEIARSQMRKDIQERAKKSSVSLNSTLPPQQLNQPEIMSRFQRQFDIQRPFDCRVSADARDVNETTDKCLKKMSAYCQFIKPYEGQIHNREPAQEDPLIADTLASELEDDFNTDPSTNEAFQQANQEFCHTQFQKKDGKSKETFFEFMNAYCATPSNEGCAKATSGDWDKLRNKYKELYTLESGALNKVDTGDHDIITADTDAEGGGTTGSAGGGGVSGGGSIEDDFWSAQNAGKLV